MTAAHAEAASPRAAEVQRGSGDPGEPQRGVEARDKGALEIRSRLLVVGDVDTLAHLEPLLSNRWDVQAVADGELALAAVRARRPDLVLADVTMPGLDGFALVHALRAEAATASIPIILLSDRAGEEAQIEARAGGADDCLVMPFSPSELLARVQSQLALALLRRTNAAHREGLRLLFTNAPMPMCLLRGPQHVFELANDAYWRLLGQRDLLGKSVHEAVPEAASQGALELLDHVWATGEPYIVKERPFRVRSPIDQREHEVLLTFTYQPFRNLQGQIEGIVFFGFDVTEAFLARRALEEHAQQARLEARRTDEFLATLGHELRNPLAALSAALQVMGHRAKGDPSSLDLHARCERQVENLSRLVDDLLDTSRITRGEVDLRRQIVDLAAVLQQAIQTTRPRMDARRHEVSITIGPGPFSIDGDPTRLEQVFVNLLANAAKYTDPEGRIAVRLKRDEGAGAPCAVVSVRDSGRGIERSKLSSVFELFMQVETGIERSEGGLGIGLTLVQRLVALHGGEVLAESDGLGQGSTFTVRLPITDTPAQPAPGEMPRRPDAADNRGRRVVVVEDNADGRECLQLLLEIEGCQVDVAADGIEGRDLILARRPDVAFIDVGLPLLDGLQLARQLRALPELQGTLLVALTGYGGDESEARAREAGFDEHLTKPVAYTDLERVLGARR